MSRMDWIEMDDRTSYKVESETTVRVSVREDDEIFEVAGTYAQRQAEEWAISKSLGERLGGVWKRTGEWSQAQAEPDVTAIWEREVST